MSLISIYLLLVQGHKIEIVAEDNELEKFYEINQISSAIRYLNKEG